VELAFETRVTDARALAAECDLLVGADGVNSAVRQAYAEELGSAVERLANWYIRYGTAQVVEALTLTFREHQGGAFLAHHYRYSPTHSTFIVECDPDTWARSGLADMADEERRRACEGVFREELDGQPLLIGRSRWLNFRVVTNRRWSHENVVLLGDALRTVHFSMGSGTRVALEDAAILARALAAHGSDVPAGLAAFEAERRPAVERFLQATARRIRWSEQFRDAMHLEPIPFAYDYVMRSGSLTYERLKELSPRFVGTYEAYVVAQGAATPG
jgi:2-polyprenyl-6-methoxyphenol hydroxylase-like FAD-dependent oxidoreductase